MKSNKYVILSAFAASLGGFLFGFDTAVISGAEKQTTYSELFEEITDTPNSILAIPKFGAIGPPDFHTGNQGCFSGLSLSHSRGDILQAILEGSAFYVKDCFEKSEEVFAQTNSLVATGGGSASDEWLQITADILDKKVIKNKITEASSLGAAIIAGVGSKIISSFNEAIDIMIQQDSIVKPDRTKTKYYKNKFEKYKELFNFLS